MKFIVIRPQHFGDATQDAVAANIASNVTFFNFSHNSFS